MINEGTSGSVFEAQRQLRTRLLDRASIRYAPARDLAAHMLLRLDDLPECWLIATQWLRAELACHRVDTGFGIQQAREYFPGFAQARHKDFDVPSFGGGAVDNLDTAMQAMWLESRPLVYADIKQDSRVSISLRRRMAGARTKSKFGWALRSEDGAYGLICADWTEHLAPWESGLFDCFEQTVADVLSPIIVVAKGIDACKSFRGTDNAVSTTLTQSELAVARLVAKGMSYKEIARSRGRSLSTIDHQLRSIRRKIAAPSTAALVSILAQADL
jgi:DNA-binding CsgD family transcriptional regulator